jgi:hypothetical protein
MILWFNGHMTTTQFTEAQQFQADFETRERNEHRMSSARNAEPCFLCGRPLTPTATANGWWIHLTTGGYLTSDFGDTQDFGTYGDSQGCFPVGSECAKRIPVAFRQRSTQPTTPKPAKPQVRKIDKVGATTRWEVRLADGTYVGHFSERSRTFFFLDTQFAYTRTAAVEALLANHNTQGA